jgi:hypothetical protein
MMLTDTRYMTTSALDTRQPLSGTLRLWTALRTRIRAGAEHRQLHRELAPAALAPATVGLAGVTRVENAVTREIRGMIRA